MDMITLKRVIAGSKFGATRDRRIAYELSALTQAAKEQGVVLPSAKRVGSAMRELGFVEFGGTRCARYVARLSVLLPIISEVMQELNDHAQSH